MGMKKSVVLCAIGLVAAIVLVVYFLDKRQAGAPPLPTESPSIEASKASPTSPTEASSSQESASQTQLELSARALKADPSRSNELVLAVEQARAKAIKVHTGQVLATINGVSITLRDLLAIDPSEKADTEHSMSEDQYKYLLDRAVDRELAMQAAQRQSVKLNPEQQDQLAQIERSSRGRDGANPENMLARLNTSASLESQIEFDKRDAAGLLMQEALLDRSGGPPLIVTEDQVQRYYQQNAARYGALPTQPNERETAWRAIDTQIRRELMYSNMEAHQTALKEYMDQLKATAEIEITDVKAKQP